MKKWSLLGISFGLMILLSACGTTLSTEEAYAIALKDAGVTEQDVVLQKETVDDDEFAFVFHTDLQQFEYEIDEDGTIEKRSVTRNPGVDIGHKNATGNDGASETYAAITQEQALDCAYAQFQVSEAEITDLYIEKEWENGQEIYDIEFMIGTKEYSCEVNAQTGAVISYDVDVD